DYYASRGLGDVYKRQGERNMMKSDEQYQVPVWMRPLLPLLCNTGGNDPEELLNDTETTASANIVRYVLIVAVRSQIDLLQLLYRKGLLRTEIPGGFSPEEAQELLDNLVRSHISKALSGERMACLLYTSPSPRDA
ncbi:hypothetical protein MU480_14810, partial [Staphylococcus aureus]|nr:hypothetical protein [Staphylococcus aureus]